MICQITTYFSKDKKIELFIKIKPILYLNILLVLVGCTPNTFFTPTGINLQFITPITAIATSQIPPSSITSTLASTPLSVDITSTIPPETLTSMFVETITPTTFLPFLPTPPHMSTIIPSQTPLIIALSEDHNNSVLYTMGLDGQLGQLLTDSAYYSNSPAWSPDCQRIAFLRDFGISTQLFVINLSNHQLTQIETPFEMVSSPDWSPDGNALVFGGGNYDTTPAQIYILDLMTHDLRQLTSEGTNYEPNWSPDGQSIVYEHYADQFSPSSIYIMDVNGENKRQLIPGQWGTDTLKDPLHYDPGQPTWSPDNQWIAFSVEETTFIYGFKASKTYLVKADGSNLHRLIEGDSENIDTDSEGFYYISELNPIWSPDSQTIFYFTDTSYRPQSDSNYCFANINSGAQSCIQPVEGVIYDMDWCSLPAIHHGTE